MSFKRIPTPPQTEMLSWSSGPISRLVRKIPGLLQCCLCISILMKTTNIYIYIAEQWGNVALRAGWRSQEAFQAVINEPSEAWKHMGMAGVPPFFAQAIDDLSLDLEQLQCVVTVYELQSGPREVYALCFSEQEVKQISAPMVMAWPRKIKRASKALVAKPKQAKAAKRPSPKRQPPKTQGVMQDAPATESDLNDVLEEAASEEPGQPNIEDTSCTLEGEAGANSDLAHLMLAADELAESEQGDGTEEDCCTVSRDNTCLLSSGV